MGAWVGWVAGGGSMQPVPPGQGCRRLRCSCTVVVSVQIVAASSPRTRLWSWIETVGLGTPFCVPPTGDSDATPRVACMSVCGYRTTGIRILLLTTLLRCPTLKVPVLANSVRT